MGTYKRVDVPNQVVFDGFSFVDDDDDEFFLDYSERSACVDMGVNGRTELTFYWKDIPSMIKVLEEAYKHCKEQG